MKLTNLLNTTPARKVKTYAPEITIVCGVGLVIYGTYKACQASRRLDEILDEHRAAVEEIKEDQTMFPQEEQKEIAKQYVKTGWEMVRLYGPAVAIGGVGVFLIFKGHGILRRRYIALVSAYSMLEKSYDMYRKRVINEFGDAMDRHFRFGTTEEEFKVTELGENGKEKTVKKKVTTIDPDFQNYSPYARCFDEFSTKWMDDPGLNKAYILNIQNYANDYLVSNKKLFLNQVYDWLGFPQTKVGQVAGWVYKPGKNQNGDNFVSFGLEEVYRRAEEGSPGARMWVDGIEPSVLLDFNCQGNILDEVFDEYI